MKLESETAPKDFRPHEAKPLTIAIDVSSDGWFEATVAAPIPGEERPRSTRDPR